MRRAAARAAPPRPPAEEPPAAAAPPPLALVRARRAARASHVFRVALALVGGRPVRARGLAVRAAPAGGAAAERRLAVRSIRAAHGDALHAQVVLDGPDPVGGSFALLDAHGEVLRGGDLVRRDGPNPAQVARPRAVDQHELGVGLALAARGPLAAPGVLVGARRRVVADRAPMRAQRLRLRARELGGGVEPRISGRRAERVSYGVSSRVQYVHAYVRARKCHVCVRACTHARLHTDTHKQHACTHTRAHTRIASRQDAPARA